MCGQPRLVELYKMAASASGNTHSLLPSLASRASFKARPMAADIGTMTSCPALAARMVIERLRQFTSAHFNLQISPGLPPTSSCSKWKACRVGL